MENVEIVKKGNKLTITVDLSKPGKESASGKSIIVASTQGNRPLEGVENTFIGLNIYKKK
jgi:hypothetical protein